MYRVTAQVKIQIYTLVSSSLSLMYSAPVKSIPVTVNGEGFCDTELQEWRWVWGSEKFSHQFVASHTAS